MSDGRTERAARQREETRARILEAALEVFASRGYHATSVSDLVEAADVARGTFYVHFESKQAVFLDLLDNLLAAFRGSVHGVDVQAGASTLRDQIVQSVVAILAAAHASRALALIVFREAVGLDEAVDARVLAFEERLQHYLEESLKNGVRLGLLRPHDTEVAATAVYGALRQAIQRHVLAAVPIDPLRLAEALVDLHLQGIAATGSRC